MPRSVDVESLPRRAKSRDAAFDPPPTAAPVPPLPAGADVVLRPWSKATSAWQSPPNRPLLMDVISVSWSPPPPATEEPETD